jgi:HD superfamily phosphohydrolase YqeK
MADFISPIRLPSELRPSIPAWAVMSAERVGHVKRVAELADRWAAQLDVPASERNRWLRAIWLHDALRDAAAAELDRLAAHSPGPTSLRHGPAAAALAKAEGETDRGVLDAVRYHSVGLAEWDMVGRVLYCADFLEPGRTFEQATRAELARRFPAAPQEVVLAVTRWRVTSLIQSGWPLPEPTHRFWNSLVGGPR